MNQYDQVTVKAVELIQKGESPAVAWSTALKEVRHSTYVKPCARAAFLGLCEEGMIIGCKKGKYSRGKKNKEYAVKALRYLVKHPEDSNLSPNELWKKASVSATLPKQTGYQMDIVIAVFNKNIFNKENV